MHEADIDLMSRAPSLVRTKEKKNWLLLKHKDRFAAPADITSQNRSVLCAVAVEDLKVVPAHRIPASRLVPAGETETMPQKLVPMLAESGDAPFNPSDWTWEPKLDGYRVLAFIDQQGVKLRSRRGLELAGSFPRLTAELARQAVRGMVLDGEIVAFDASGRPSFNALQNRVQLKTERKIAAADQNVPVVLYCFDLLHFAGIGLRKAPYKDRRRYLAQQLLPSPIVQLVHAAKDGVAMHEAALASGFEGVIGKRKDSRYESGRRSQSWPKIKPTCSADFVNGGYTRGKGSREPLGALLVGYWDKGKLRFASRVGPGFDQTILPQAKARLDALKRNTCPFTDKPELNAPTTWIEPTVVAEVSFQSWTEDGSLRAPVFLRLRDDVDPKKVRRAESPLPATATSGDRLQGADIKSASGKGRDSRRGNDNPGIRDVIAQLEGRRNDLQILVGPYRIRLTNLDRVYWPEDIALKQPALTKRDLLRHFAQVSTFLLPHLADRLLTMFRMLDGIRGQRFFQKHWEQERPQFVETITAFSEHRDESHEYLLCNNLPTLLWLAQCGTLEFHVWQSRARPGPDAAARSTDYATSEATLERSVLNYPDYVVFDIDPYIYSGNEASGAEPELNTVAFENALFARALRDSRRCALGRWAARGKQHIVMIRPVEDGLVMQPPLYADEVRSIKDIEIPKTEVKDAELQLAQQLIEQQASDGFDPGAYTDEVRVRVEAAIQKKVEGQEITMAEAPEGGAQVVDLMEALRASLAKKEAAPARVLEPQTESGAASRKPPKRAQQAEPAARKSAKK